MQILHWPLTCPQASSGNFGGSNSPPLLEQRERLLSATSTIFPSPSDPSQMSYSAGRASSNSFVSNGPSVSAVALSEEHDDNLQTYYILNSTPEQPQTPMDTANYTPENGEAQPPLIANGNERNDPSGGDDHPPPHYSDTRPGGSGCNGNQENEEEDEDEDEFSGSNNQGSNAFGSGELETLEGEGIETPKAMLVVSLYAPSQGYTYHCFLPRTEADGEDFVYRQSHLIPYSETYLLDCIDSETIPLRLLSKLDKYDGINLMCYQSHVLCEVRDFRRFQNAVLTPSPLIRQILLKPNTQTILSDLDGLIEKGYEDLQMSKRILQAAALKRGKKAAASGENGYQGPYKRARLDIPNGIDLIRMDDGEESLTLEQRLELEKEVVRETAPLLCLDPSKTIGLIANQAQYERLKWNAEDLKKSVVSSLKRRERLRRALESEEEVEHSDDVYEDGDQRRRFIPFFRFVNRKKQLKRLEEAATPDMLRLPPITYSEFPPLLQPTNMEDILKIGQPAEPATLRPMFSENYVKKVEEYILETERRKRPHTTRLTIYQRNGTESYYGELEQESFIEPNGFNNGIQGTTPNTPGGGRSVVFPSDLPGSPASNLPSSKCQFELGSSRSVTLYVKQFTDIFTEDGRRPCKISYQKIGQQTPQVAYTNSYKSLSNNNNNVVGAVVSANGAVLSGGSSPSVAVPALTPAGTPPPSIVPPVVGTIPNSLPQPIPGSASPSLTSQPPVQIVYPQPRSTQQIHPIQIYTTSVGTLASAPTTMTFATNTTSSAAANLNFNLNVNSVNRIVRQQLLTRPQIINLQQQHPTQHHVISRQQAPQLIQSQPQHAQHGFRITKQPTLATLLLTGLHPNSGSKPITVAIQPQPQNSSIATSSNASGQMQAIQIANSMDGHQAINNSHLQSSSQAHHPANSSPIMIMVSPATGNSGNTISIPSSGTQVVGTQGHGGSVSLNLNAISIDGLLSSVSNAHASNMSNFITTTTGGNSGNGQGIPMSLSNQLNTLNILRLSNSTNTVTLQPQHHGTILRQGNISLMSQAGRGGVQQGHPAMMNVNTTGILLNPATSTTQMHVNMNNVGLGGNIMQKGGPASNRMQVHAAGPSGQELDELSVPDLNSLLNGTTNVNTASFRNGPPQSSSTGSMEGSHGLNLDVNVNLNLNLSGHTHRGGPQPKDYDQSHHHNGREEGDGVNSFLNALSEAIGPELGSPNHKNTNQRIVSSSMSPSTTPKSSSVMTLNDLLGSPPMVSSSTTNMGMPPAQSPLQMQLQSPQSPSISSILSPISPNVSTTGQSSLAYSTPRLSALLAGTPSADSTMMSTLVDSSISSTSNNIGVERGSYGNLLDRLTASRSQPQIIQRSGGSLLSPIATATPSVVLEHPVLAASLLTQGPNPNLHLRQGMARPSYRQIAPAPPPQQQQQLINLLGLVSNPNNPGSRVQNPAQATIRINSGNPSPSASGNR